MDEPNQTPEDEAPAAQVVADPPEGQFITFRRTYLYAAMLPVAFVTGLAVGFLAWGRNQPAATAGAQPVAAASQDRVEVDLDDDPALGPLDAPITIVEFSDFNCPYCQRFHQQTFRSLLDSYPDQIHFVYRDYPITTQESFIAAQAAECANEQGEYWAYHDALFSGQYELGATAYRLYAEQVSLDADALLACIDEGRYAEEVQADARYAASLGVSGTPTFFINGIPLVGAQPLSRFTQVIDEELN